MEVIGTTSSVAALAEQSLNLLSRIQEALNRQKHNAIHLTAVLNDVETTKTIINRAQNSPQLDNDDVVSSIKSLIDIAIQLEKLVAEQEKKAIEGKGFRLFAHEFINGPQEQRELEALRSELVVSRGTLTLVMVTQLAPSGLSLKQRM